MYSDIPQGKEINIQGLNCIIPHEGYVTNIVNNQLEKREIYHRSTVKEDQYWERIIPPEWYKETMKKWEQFDKKKKEDDDTDFYDERLEQYKKQEWDRRLNGFWFYNNGQPVYLTGMHYMYLQWWQIDIGFPKFRITDLEYFYFLQYCIEDNNCMGMLEITKRRFGKTFRGGLFLYEYITRTKRTNAGIQSKTGTDAKKLYNKAVINPFITLPKFFRPEYDMGGGIRPKTSLVFQQTNVRGKKAESGLDKEELGSMIDHEDAELVAYDGQKLHRYFSDEWAKTVAVNIYERHEIIRYCLMDDEGNIIGKALYSSTVEKLDTDKDGVQEAAKLLWDDSDHNNRDENGKTPSGLYRFFMTADRARHFDVYGYPNTEKTVKEILADRESVKNNPRSLAARIRKEARTIEEAWLDDGENCVFNIINVNDRDRFLKDNPIPRRNILYYRDSETQKVKWRDVRKAEDFYWSVTPDCELDTANQNKYVIDSGAKKPANTKEGAISVDSYSNSQGGRKYGSKASAWLGIRKNGVRKAVGWLYGRPDTKEILHEQVMLCAEYFGYLVYYEHTSDDYLSFFRERGKVGYLGIYPMSLIDHAKRNKENIERFKGTPITPFSLTKQLDNGINYFEDHIDWIDFPEMFPFAKKFDPYNRTESDAIVSFLILITVLFENPYAQQPRKSPLIQVYENGKQVTYN